MECNTSFILPSGLEASYTPRDFTSPIITCQGCFTPQKDSIKNDVMYAQVVVNYSLSNLVLPYFPENAKDSIVGVHTLNVITYDEANEIYSWRSDPITINFTDDSRVIKEVCSQNPSGRLATDIYELAGATVIIGFEKKRVTRDTCSGPGLMMYRRTFKVKDWMLYDIRGCHYEFTDNFIQPYINKLDMRGVGSFGPGQGLFNYIYYYQV